MTQILVDVFGWGSAISLLAAYILISLKKLQPDGFIYQAINILGAIGLGINAFYYHAFPSVAVNVVWLFVGAVMLFRIYKKRAGRKQSIQKAS